MEYNAKNNSSPEQRQAFLESLTRQTVAELKNAQGDEQALVTAIQSFIERVQAANLPMEDIENILGVNENSIMDLAELSDADEEIVLDIFENFFHS